MGSILALNTGYQFHESQLPPSYRATLIADDAETVYF